MRIRNINGTSDTDCSCGSWLNHWKKFGGNKVPVFCAVKTCANKDLVGAHVQVYNGLDDKWYICPLCKEHNKATNILEISQDIKLVPANKKETCEKISSRLRDLLQ